MNKNIKSRVSYIDIAKGLCISLVALFHGKITYFLPGIIEPMSLFRVPLFFFLSGIFFSHSENFVNFSIRKADILLKPYFTVLALFFIIFYLTGNDIYFWQIRGIFYGTGETIPWTPLWFLTHLFIVYLFSYIFFKALHSGKRYFKESIAIVVILFAFNATFIDYFQEKEVNILEHSITLYGLPFSLDLLFISFGFFFSGYTFRKAIINFNPNHAIFFAVFIIFVCISIYTNAHIDFNKRNYISVFPSTVGSACGIYIVLYLSYFISKFRWPSYVFDLFGRSSLFILIFHDPIQSSLYHHMSQNIDKGAILSLISVICFLLCMLIPVVLKQALNNIPYLSGIMLPIYPKKVTKPTHS